MSSEFAHQVIKTLEPEALARVKGGVFRRLFLGSGRPSRVTVYGRAGQQATVRLPERGRFSRSSYMTAIGEVAETFTAEQRDAFLSFGTLPDGFWDEVERRAKEWDSIGR